MTAIRATPGTNHPFGGTHPEIAGQAIRHASEGQPIHEHGLDRFRHNPVGIERIGTQERRLSAEIPPACRAVMHTHRDPQEHGRVEIQINGGACRIPYSPGRAATTIARQRGLYPAHLADLARSLEHGACRGHGVDKRMAHDKGTFLGIAEDRHTFRDAVPMLPSPGLPAQRQFRSLSVYGAVSGCVSSLMMAPGVLCRIYGYRSSHLLRPV